jgi:hypothetical protein
MTIPWIVRWLHLYYHSINITLIFHQYIPKNIPHPMNFSHYFPSFSHHFPIIFPSYPPCFLVESPYCWGKVASMPKFLWSSRPRRVSFQREKKNGRVSMWLPKKREYKGWFNDLYWFILIYMLCNGLYTRDNHGIMEYEWTYTLVT